MFKDNPLTVAQMGELVDLVINGKITGMGFLCVVMNSDASSG